jgi:SAM-dependent methyltransferase
MVGGGAYLLGHTDREQRRLAGQAALIGPDTEALFRDAGLGPGMSVLDVGSGLGDVAILAGKLVSPGGWVLGIERSTEGIAVARQRAKALPDIDVRFELADLDAYEPQQTFHALVGRFVLAYLKEPSAALHRLAKYVRPGGIVAMVEFDVRAMCVSPHSPLHQQVIDWIVGAFEGSGVNPSLGSDIAKVFHDAGLPWPSVKSVQYAASGPDGPLWYYSDLLRTLMPNVERLGLATTDMVEIESLADRLSAEAEAKKTTAFLPRWVCAWARVS